MSFLKVKTKKVLVEIELLPLWAYIASERLAITKSKGFYSWSTDGYYMLEDVKIVNDKE